MINLMEVNWQQLAAAMTMLIAVTGGLYFILQAKLSKTFATEAIVDARVAPLSTKIVQIEAALTGSPTRRDLVEVEGRVERVERQVTEVQRTVTEVQVGVAALRAGQDGMRTELSNVNRQLSRITEHLLREAHE